MSPTPARSTAEPDGVRIVPPLEFRPDIEGLRAIAIIMVVAFHAGVPFMGGGFLGVDVFFVLSGYLITWLLLDQTGRTQRIDYVAFYAARARRLLPALFVFVTVSAGIAAILYSPIEHETLARSAIATLVYLSNAYFARSATSYHGELTETNPFLHTWSLAVEEQFYLVWPAFIAGILVLSRRNGRRPTRVRLLAYIGILGGLSFLASVIVTAAVPVVAFFLTPIRAWEFCAGAAARLLPPIVELFGRRAGAGDRNASRGAVVLLGMAAIVISGVVMDSRTPVPSYPVLLPVLGAALVINAGPKQGWMGSLLTTRWIQFVGKRSYSWYLWHWPLLVFGATVFDPLLPHHILALVVVSLLLADASYRWLEQPIRTSASLRARPRRSLTLAAVGSVVCLAAVFGWRALAVGWSENPVQAEMAAVRADLPELYARGCDISFYSDALQVCTFGRSDASRTAVLIGDSKAAQWFPAVDGALSDDEWKVVVLTKSACPAIDTSFYFERVGRLYRECDSWRRRAVTRIDEIDPHLVVISSGVGYSIDPGIWQQATAAILERVAAPDRRIVLIRDTPPLQVNLPLCHARNAWREAILGRLQQECRAEPQTDPRQRTIFRRQQAAAARFDNVSVVDMTAYLCLEPIRCAGRAAASPYRDTGHISATFAASLADELSPALRSPAARGLDLGRLEGDLD